MAVAFLATASLASAAVGDLAYRDCITGETETGPSGSRACAPADVTGSGGADSGLDRLRSDAVSPDGRSLYTTSVYDDAVARFDRDPTTGRLTYRGCITGETQSGPAPGGSGACAQIGSATSGGTDSGLDELRSVAVSPDGEWLYAAATEDAAVARFARDPTTGQLSYRGCITGEAQSGPGGSGACAEIESATPTGSNSGLYSVTPLAMSPDGSSLYTGSHLDDSVARFDRNPTTGELTYRGCITGKAQSGPGGSGACAAIGSATTGGADSGLDSLVALATSPGGGSIYAASELDDAVARFDRDPATGQLTYRDCITGETQSGSACARIGSATSGGAGSGLNELHSVAVSPDEASLYTASQFDDAVARFDRSTAGALTYRGCVTGDAQYGLAGSGACAAIPSAATGGANSGLDTLRAVATSPDGKSLYAASAKDDGVARFDRDASGALAYRDCTSGETQSAPACARIASATSAGNNSGLDSPRSIAASPDGTSLYAGARDDDAVAGFDREAAPGGNSPPTASFTHACTGLDCSFDGSASSDPDGTISSYAWSFGDGTTGTGATASHTYAATDTYTVTLTVTDDKGATASQSQSVSVTSGSPNAAPTASFTHGCTDLDCSFDGTASSDPDGTISSYAWDFGDGTTGSGATPSHTYAATGTYTVTLTVTDDKGATASQSQSVSVTSGSPNAAPTASFTHGCTDLDCSFDGTASSDPDGTISSYAWSFGDGTTGTGATASHTYAAAGTYTVTLTVTDDNGATASQSQSVSVTSGTTPALTITSITPNAIVPGTTPVTIGGSGLVSGTKVSFENGKGPEPRATVTGASADGTSLSATVYVKPEGPKGSHQWDVRVTNPDNSIAVLVDGLTVTR